MGATEWITVFVVVLAVGGLALWVRATVRHRRRRLPTTIGHVRIEMLPPVVVEDRIVEQVWRVAILMKNNARRPALVPELLARATVRTRAGEFLGDVSLEREVRELNPAATLLGWVDAELPAGAMPRRVSVSVDTATGILRVGSESFPRERRKPVLSPTRVGRV